MYVRGYLQGSENGRVVTIGKYDELPDKGCRKYKYVFYYYRFSGFL